MNSYSEENIIFDTSAIIKFVRKYPGYQRVGEIFQKAGKKQARASVSPLTLFEVINIIGAKNPELAIKTIAYLEKITEELPLNSKTAKKAALSKIKNPSLLLSMADWIILQTAIDENLTAVTSDKEWAKVKEAKVKVI